MTNTQSPLTFTSSARGALSSPSSSNETYIKRRAHRGNVSNHVGRQSDAVPSTTPAAAGWSRTSRESVSFGRSHSGARRASRRAGGGPRAVVARGGAGRRSRDKKKGETQGPPHCHDGGQEVGEIGGEERVSEHFGTHTRRTGGLMPGRRRLVVPRRQRSIPLPFRSQRGGWISGHVPKPPGYDMTR